jgi:hypothetical protein
MGRETASYVDRAVPMDSDIDLSDRGMLIVSEDGEGFRSARLAGSPWVSRTAAWLQSLAGLSQVTKHVLFGEQILGEQVKPVGLFAWNSGEQLCAM